MVYAVLIMILRKECRAFPVPDWLAEDECWRDQERADRQHRKLLSRITAL